MMPSSDDYKYYNQDVVHLSHFTQSYGVLIVLRDPELTIAQISSNVEAWFGRTPQSLLDQPLTTLFAAATVQPLGDRLGQETGNFFYRFQGQQAIQGQLKSFHGLLRRHAPHLVLELELIEDQALSPAHPRHYHERLKTFLNKITPETSFQATADLVVQEGQRATGCDRMLLYQFMADESGLVIAEASKDPDSQPRYQGLRFPAIDVPFVARRTFSANRLRMITDFVAPQAELVPPINPITNQPFNSIASMLMGVSPCHIEYCQNMGVRATLVVALMDGDRLWGLMVGQHDSPNYLDPDLRNYCDSLGHLMSLELPRKQAQEVDHYRQTINHLLADLREDLRQIDQDWYLTTPPNSPDVIRDQSLAFSLEHPPEDAIHELLKQRESQLLTLVQAQGAAIMFGKSLTLIGQTPEEAQVRDLLAWFATEDPQELTAIANLGAVYPPAQSFATVASGVLGISIYLQNTAYYLLWFRPEITQTVHWAGDPTTATTLDSEGNLQLCPRKSFEIWQEIVQGQSTPWHAAEIAAARELRDLLAQAALKLSQIAWEMAAEQARIANQAKSQFLAKMSHELRTPLNAILGFSQIMNRDEALSLEHRQNLKIINRSGEHLLSLINDVLEMSKIEAGRMNFNESSFNLYQMIEAIAEMLQLKASAKNLQLMLDCDPQLPQYVTTDEGKLRQVLINLLGNAIKFTNEGWVKLRVFPGQFPTQILFEVSDTGPGIAPEEQHLLFDPFTQTESGRKSMQGTGLGLPICKQFVNLLGGDFVVESGVNQGSIFRFDVQVKIADSIETPASPLGQSVIGVEPGQPHYRILIVEDGEDNRLLLLKLLSPLGFDVRTANHGQEAIAVWKVWQPHLIWMDLLMPVMDGYEATQRIRALPGGTETVIIALTANAFNDAQHAALEVGCNDYLPKPYQADRLFELMAKHLGIRYCYRAETQGIKLSSGSKFILTPQSLKVMPPQWRSAVEEAALGMEEDRLAELIAEIPADHQNLAQNLTHLVENFRLDLILDLTHGDD